MGSTRWSQWTLTSPRNPRRWAAPTNTACSARSTVGHTRALIHVTAVVLTRMVLLSRRMGAQVSPIQKKGEAKVQTLHRFSTQSQRKHSASTRISARNVALTTWKAMMTPTTVPEVTSQIALGNYMYIRNVN